jgi:hypothetical protein
MSLGLPTPPQSQKRVTCYTDTYKSILLLGELTLKTEPLERNTIEKLPHQSSGKLPDRPMSLSSKIAKNIFVAKNHTYGIFCRNILDFTLNGSFSFLERSTLTDCNSPTTQQAYMTPAPLESQGKDLYMGLWFSMSGIMVSLSVFDWHQIDIVFLSKGPVLLMIS